MMRSLLGLLLLCWQVVSGSQEQLQIQVLISNESGSKLFLHWVNPETGETVPFAQIEKSEQRFGVNTFLGHEFEINEMPSDDSGVCNNSSQEDQTCKVNRLKITDTHPTQSVIVNPGLELQRHIGHTDMVATAEKIEDWVFEDLEPDELLAKCQDDAKRQLEGSTPEDQVMRSFNACLKFSMLGSLKHKEDEVSFQTRLRDDTSLAMENFTCTNAELDSSPDIDQRDWTSEKDGVTRKVHVKLERSASRIHAIENFAYPEECDAMEETAAPQLQRAAVADGKGGSIESKNRKAMQAGIVPEWEKEKDGDLVTRLSRRVYDYTNYALGLNITEHGQEPLMSIQYFGRGYNDTEPDRYTPHCDGECVGAPHIPGTRMATMVIYCTIPERGGHTNFRAANVHVKPGAGSAIFFSYIDPETNITDRGLTTHSGCPVYEGEKKIITQWVRYGVDSETTHNSFNTLGILLSEDGE